MEKEIQILVVEDDNDINKLLCNIIRKSGYTAQSAYSGTEAMLYIKKREWDMVLLDLMLPGITGEEALLRIREHSSVPVIIISAKGEAQTKVNSLRTGADDYITKPFDPSQLVARVRSHLKRYERLTAGRDSGKRQTSEPERIVVDDVVIEPRTWKVWKNGNELKLPNREFELLRFLAENPNIVFSKEELFEKIWGYDYISDAATVSVHINHLREKIEDDARNPKIIETVWGAGYRLNM